jgi:glyoxylase-like metal-dependent hydrolase (beta-lactamase superfamily II)
VPVREADMGACDPSGVDDVGLVIADNPGPLTLHGTNTWLVGRDPCWVVDPGPDLDAHLRRILSDARDRGGIGGIALTHDHYDHVALALRLRDASGGVPIAAAAYEHADVRLADGARFGPLEAVATPGHAPDHLAFVAGGACCTGDAVLGAGSVFVGPGPGSLAGYLDALERLRARQLTVLCPGHGPVVLDPAARLTELVEHRRERERRLLAALDDGLRGSDELLDRVWADAPSALRGAALLTLTAHLEKLDEEGRLPEGVERPELPATFAV